MPSPAVRAGWAEVRPSDLPQLARAADEPIVQVPRLGGSVPMYLFAETLRKPVIGVPIVNHDNNQHGINESLRLQNLWDGIEVFAELMADLGTEK